MGSSLVENEDYAQMVKRVARAYGRRLAEGDPEDLRSAFEVLRAVEAAIADGVRGQRKRWQLSWADIARPLGITRQAAQQRWG